MTKVLIVEDEAMLSEAYTMILSANGFETEVACNGIEALQKIDAFQPDVVLLDLLMPRMDGITFLETYAPDPTQPPRIIVCSNLFDGRKVKQVKSLGAHDIILKSSMTPDALVKLVSTT